MLLKKRSGFVCGKSLGLGLLLLLIPTTAHADFDPVELRAMLHFSVGYGVTMASYGLWKAIGVKEKDNTILLAVVTGITAGIAKNVVEHFVEQERWGASGTRWMAVGAGAAGATLFVLPF